MNGTTGEPRTEAEHRLAAARLGGVVELADLDSDQAAVSAASLRAACVAAEAGADPRGLRIRGGRVVDGPLDLSFCTRELPLGFEGTTFTEAPVLDHSRLRQLELDGCDLPGLGGAGLRVDHDLRLVACRVAGAVGLRGAEIGGDVDLSGTRIANDGLTVEDASIGGNLWLLGAFSAIGTVTLSGARVAGRLDCSGATLSTPGGWALVADSVDVGRSAFLRAMDATGEVRLLAAKIGGDLDFLDSRLANPGGAALSLDGASVGGSLYLNGRFEATGAVTLAWSKVAGSLHCGGATFRNADGPALAADSAEIGLNAFLRDVRTAGEVRFLAARIGRDFDCVGAVFRNRGGSSLAADSAEIGLNAFLRDVRTTGELRFVGARIGRDFDCLDSRLANRGGAALSVDGIRVAGGLYLNGGFAAVGAVSLSGAHVAGLFQGSGARLVNRSGAALAADSADFGGVVFLRSVRTRGEMRFITARINTDFDCLHAQLTNPGGAALTLEGAEVGGSVYLNGDFAATGAVGLAGAQVRRGVNCAGASLCNPGGAALAAEGIDVVGSVSLAGASVEGTIALSGARVAGRLDLTRATLAAPGSTALAARSAELGRAVVLREATIDGGVDLYRAMTDTLADDAGPHGLGSWSGARPLRLEGFSYTRFADTAESGSRARRRWLRATDGFQQGAWQQLIQVYRAQGRDDEVNRTAIAMHGDRRKHAGLPRHRRWGRWVLGATVGHGYRPWLAGAWAMAVMLLFSLVVWLGDSGFAPEKEEVKGDPQPAAYSADVFLPIIDLGEAGRHMPTDWGRWVEWPVIMLGWALTTIFVAGFTRIVRT